MPYVSCSLSLHGVLEPTGFARLTQILGDSTWFADTLDIPKHAPAGPNAFSGYGGFWDMIGDFLDQNGVLTLPMMAFEDEALAPDTDVIDAAVALGLAACWSWRPWSQHAAGMDVWDPRDGKGQRFWLSPDDSLLVPIERLTTPHALAHYRRFAALAQALPQVPFCAAPSAHALLAQRARYPDDAFAPIHAPLDAPTALRGAA